MNSFDNIIGYRSVKNELEKIADFFFKKGVKNVIVIDHHTLSNEKFGRISYVLEASSTCEILYGILKKLNIKFTEEISKYLLSGILTDTGKFSHSVSAKTIRIVSKLLAFGKHEMESLTTPLFNSMSFNSFEMLKKLYKEFKSKEINMESVTILISILTILFLALTLL